MKTCQKWITGSDDDDDDEGIDEDVQSEMTGVFLDMAPILQNVPGGHWELIFDIIENNLEVSLYKPLFLMYLTTTSPVERILQ